MQNICLALAKNQKAQQKCFDELENVNFTSDRFEDTPYFWATVKEGLRYMPSIYRSLVHTVTVVSKNEPKVGCVFPMVISSQFGIGQY